MAYGPASNNETTMSYPQFLQTMGLKDGTEAKAKYELFKSASKPKAATDVVQVASPKPATPAPKPAATAKPIEDPTEKKLSYDEFRKQFSLADGTEAQAKYSLFVKNGGTLKTALAAPGALNPLAPKPVTIPAEIANAKIDPNSDGAKLLAQAKADREAKEGPSFRAGNADTAALAATVPASVANATTSTSDFPDYQSYLKMNGLKDTPEEQAKYKSLVLAQPAKSTLSKDRTEAQTIPDMGEDKFTTEGTLKRSFWDELARNRDALKSMGLDFYDFGSDKATTDQLEKVKAGNPKLWEEFVKNNGKLNLSIQEPKEAEPEIDPRFQNKLNQVAEWDKQKPPAPLKPAEVAKVAEPALKDAGLTKEGSTAKNPEIDWDKVAKTAGEVGMSILGLLQAAIAGWVAAKQERAFDYESETMLGREGKEKRGIAAEQRRLQQEQELQKSEAATRATETEAATKSRREEQQTERAWQLQVMDIQTRVRQAEQAAEQTYQDKVRAETNQIKIQEAQKERDAAIRIAQIQGKQAIDQIQARASAETGAVAPSGKGDSLDVRNLPAASTPVTPTVPNRPGR